MKILPYETVHSEITNMGKCITPFPNGMTHPSGNPLKVGSGGCRMCQHFIELVDYPQQVKCGFPVIPDKFEPNPLCRIEFDGERLHVYCPKCGYDNGQEELQTGICLASNTVAQLSEDDMGWCWDEGDGAIKVIFPNETDGGLLILDDQSFDRHFEMVFSKNLFLHELQHALRLCGIDKTIDI